MSKQALLELIKTAEDAAAKAEGSPAEADRAADALKALGKQEVTMDLLIETGLGKRAKKLGKSKAESVSKAAQDLVASWKKVVAAATTKKEVKEVKKEGGEAKAEVKAEVKAEEPKKEEGGKGSIASTGNDFRDKVRGLLADALKLAVEDVPGSDPHKIAGEIETQMYSMYEGAGGEKGKDYKAKYRSLSFNLKDNKNPDLRRSVLEGDVTAHRLCTMKPEEMASDSMKAENERIREQRLFDSNPAAGKKSQSTDQFQCGKCKQRKCTYYQMQTRSADEPMTTFVQCVNCDNRWKFC